MSEFHDTDWTVEQDNDSDLVKQLRKQLREKSKEASEATKELASFRAEKRATTIEKVLQSKGVNPKVAKLLPPDTEPTEAAVEAWLTEFGDVFNIQRGEGSGIPAENPGEAAPGASQGAGVDPATLAALTAAQATEAAGTPLAAPLGSDAIRKLIAENKGKGSGAAFEALKAAGVLAD